MKNLKKEIRVLGIDDSPLEDQEEIRCIGTIYRGGNYIDGLLSFEIDRDGIDSTSKIIEAVNKSKHKEQLQYIMIDGITLAGFNVVNINKVYQETELPIIVVMRKEPDMEKFLEALDKVNSKGKKVIQKADKPQKVKVNSEKLFIQTAGLAVEKAKQVLEITCTNSNIPEPLRVAHLIASGIYYGESHGSA